MIFLTTTKLSDKYNIESSYLFEELNRLGWIERNNKRWVLTNLGIEKGGETRSAPEIGEFVVWPENLDISEITRQSPVDKVDSYDDDESEGEDYIAEYFDSIGMEFREQHLIEKLDDKFAKYRITDFYLPKYKVMVEFAGRWNRSQDERIRYRNKKLVYQENSIPCVWIYPDNLGVLHYMFHRRLETVLGTYGMEKELFRFRLHQYLKATKTNFFGIAFGLVLVLYIFTPWKENSTGVWFSISIVAYNSYHVIRDFILILKGTTVSVSRLNKWEE